MIKRWMGLLLTSLALSWARLPGPSARPKPEGKFRCRPKSGTEGKEAVEVSTNASSLSLFSVQAKGITMEKVELHGEQPILSGYVAASPVTIEMPTLNKVELSGLNPAVSEVLVEGVGTYALVTGVEKEGQLYNKDEAIIRGDGQGLWEILKTTTR